MTAAIWTIMSSDDGNGPYIAIAADSRGANYVLPEGKSSRKLTEDRVQAIAESRGAPPMSPLAWIRMAALGFGPVKLGKFHAAPDLAKARAEALIAVNALHRRPSGTRAKKLADIAEGHYVFAMTNAQAHDPAAAEDRKDYSVWNADWAATPEEEQAFIERGLRE